MTVQRTHLDRRRIMRLALGTTLATGVGAGAVALGRPGPDAEAAPGDPVRPRPSPSRTDPEVEALEALYAVKIGLYAARLNHRGQVGRRRIAHRPGDRFPLCSTFKVLAAAAVLDKGTDLEKVVRYTGDDLVDYSPVTGERRSMAYGDLCDAALRYSDNTAGNLLLERIGGPAGLTRYVGSLGDRVTRLDRWETELNEAAPGDPRDTTTPAAIARTYLRLLVGDGLAPRDRRQLLTWMQGNTTSTGKFRAGLPVGWWFADKTGSGAYGSANDVGLVTAPSGTRLLVAAMTRTDDPDAVTDPALMTDLARLVVARLA